MTQCALESKKKKKGFSALTKCTLVLVLLVSIVKETQANLYFFDGEKK